MEREKKIVPELLKPIKTSKEPKNSYAAYRKTLLFSDNKRFLSTVERLEVQLWDIQNEITMASKFASSKDKEYVIGLALMNDQKRFISSGDKNLKIWSLENPKEPFFFIDKAHDAGINTLILLDDDQTVLSGCDGGVIKVWTISDNKLLFQKSFAIKDPSK